MLPLELLMKFRPSAKTAAFLGAVAFLLFLIFSFIKQGQRIAVLEAALAAKPRVEFKDRVVEKRVVVKGPVHVVKVENADGSKTTTVDRAVETVNVDRDREHDRVETPVTVPGTEAKTRYAGVLAGSRGLAGVRAGISLGRSWDLGAVVVRRDRSNSVGAELTFRW
jgi:hypothetical protein